MRKIKDSERIRSVNMFNCPVCGKQFYYPPCYQKRNNHPTCSIACAHKNKLRKKVSNQHITVKCEYCQKELSRKPSQTKWKHIFCDKKCRGLFESGKPKVERVPCPICGKLFHLMPALKKRSKTNCCSRQCMQKLIDHLPTTSYCKYGAREDLDNIIFRSSWEANYARYLNYKKEQGLITKWEYETEKIDLNNDGVYWPDFIVFIDTEKLYVEVKGYMDSRSKRKLDAFKFLYPEKKIEIIANKEMQIIKDLYSKKLKHWEYGTNSNDGLR